MAKNAPSSPLIRPVITLAALLLGVLVLFGIMSSGPDRDDAPQDTNPPQQQADADPPKPQGDDGDTPESSEGDTPAKPPTTADTEDNNAPSPGGNTDPPTTVAGGDDPADGDAEAEPAPPGPLDNLRPAFAEAAEPIGLGSDDPESEFELYAEINPYRAAIHRVVLANVAKQVNGEERYTLLEPLDLSDASNTYPTIGSYAAVALIINEQRVRLWEQSGAGDWLGHWRVDATTDESVTLSLTIQGGPDDAPQDVVRITRTFRITPGSHTVSLDQRVENLTDQPLTIQWQQLAQSDVKYEKNDYLRGRSRQYVTGYFDDDFDPARFSVYVKDGFISRPDLIGKLKDAKPDDKWQTVWPNPQVDQEDKVLAWLASENRYFVAITSADVAPDTEETADVTALQEIYPTIQTDIYPDAAADREMPDDDRHVLIYLNSRQLKLAPGKTTQAADLSLDLFVGPREDAIFAQSPYQALRFERTIRYSLGGFCGVCTFQWLANLLLGFLELLHAVTFDWGVAIIILVLVVRLCLHPLTKRGQTSMMMMGKQMAAVQPELTKLKKKYADDPRQMQQAQMQLFREKGINPAAGALGCLPMFLQMPIWIALYAMLYYAIELRHEPAFYGVFQVFGNWPFLADLSSADRFIPLFANDGGHVFNLIFIRLDYSSINILPILMGITFFINMKFTTPPPMNEQQATQQKIMRIMPLLFPFFLYSAPSGLTLYIFASTLGGIVDSYIVRKHVKQLEESGDLFKPKQHKPGGFMDRLHKAAEMRAQQAEELKKQKQQGGRGPQQYKKKRKR